MSTTSTSLTNLRGGLAEDLDPAVLDRVDEQLEVALPTEALRSHILKLYFSKYLVEAQDSRGGGLLRGVTTLVSGRGAPYQIDVSSLDQVCLHSWQLWHVCVAVLLCPWRHAMGTGG